jgi:hypothetical protein
VTAAVDLPPDVAALIEERTRGWDDDKKRQFAAHMRAELGRIEARFRYPTAGALAKALDPNTKQTPALQKIDDLLEEIDRGDVDRAIITIAPQEGKSTRVARYGALYLLQHDPRRRVAIASYADSLAGGHGAFIRDQIEAFGSDAPLVGGRDLLGLRVSRASRSRTRWALAGHRGSLRAVGLRSGLTGEPVDVLIIDDPFADRQEADSLTTRNFVWGWWTDVALARGPKVVILIMTRWHEDDLAGRLLEEDLALPADRRRWRVLNIPTQCEDPAADPLGRQLGEYLQSARDGSDGGAVHDEAFFEEKKRNARTWAALYQGHPTPSEGGIFKWDWIRPYRVPADQVPALQRVVVAVDTTGGGSDEAGIVAAGRDASRRTYVLADRSGHYSAAGQWRHAWFTVLDLEADVLVYEANLVDPVQRKAIPASWRRMREQAAALKHHGALDEDLEPEDLDARVRAAAEQLAGRGDDDVTTADDPLTALMGQLREVLPYADRILAAPENGPARVEKVHATRGKRTRAEPASQAYETGQVSHAGVFPALEQELVTWQEGQDSPNRLDAAVWAWTFLNSAGGPSRVRSAAGRSVPTGAAAAVRR